MSGRRRWVVLVPGEVTWAERRAREILEEEDDEGEYDFMVIPGQGRYQSIVEKSHQDLSPETLLGRLLSLECDEPVYVIQGIGDIFYIARFHKGGESMEEQEREELARSLGCMNEWTVEPPLEPLTKPTRTAGLIQGLSATRVLNALAQKEGQPLPPGYCHIEESPRGVIVKEGAGWLGSALIELTFRFPRATIYSVTATPSLDFFSVWVTRNRKTVEFVPPLKKATYHPPVHEVLGEREPERILAALGIPKEWFQL
jgi:hypothetical protein